MFKTFMKGVAFGIGFIVAIGFVGYIAYNYYDSAMKREIVQINEKHEFWKELTPEEKIITAAKIVIVRFSNGEDNLKVASISNVYSKQIESDVAFEVGDLYPKGNYYPLSEHENRSATIFLFMAGMSRPSSTWHAYDEKIPAAGNMPIELLVKKLKGT